MSWTAQSQAPVHVLVYRLPEYKIRLAVGTQSADLDPEQRRSLAEYLVSDLPE